MSLNTKLKIAHEWVRSVQVKVSGVGVVLDAVVGLVAAASSEGLYGPCGEARFVVCRT